MSTVRTLVERMSRGGVLQRKIKVGNRRLPIMVSPDAQLKYLKPGADAFDRDLVDIAISHVNPSDIAWDIGANVGVFTFAAASIASHGRILAVEADIWLASLLRKTKAHSTYTGVDVSVLPAAISDSLSVASFMVAARGRASNSLAEAGGRSQMGGVREVQHVPTLTLDSLVEDFGSPDFIKVDVEGAELLVLKGASKILRDIRPTFYMEVGANLAPQIFDLFAKNGYTARNSGGHTVQIGQTDNVLFTPLEKV